MTAQELMIQVFEESGESSDRCPFTTPGDETTFDITLPASVKLLRHVNTGLLRIANWVFPDGKSLRFKHLITRAYFQTNAPVAQTAEATLNTSTTIHLPGFAVNAANQFRSWIVEITAGTGIGQKRLIVSNTVPAGGTALCTVNSAWDTTPDGTSVVSLYKSFFRFVGTSLIGADAYHIQLDAVDSLLDVMRVRDIDQLTDLTPTERTDIFTSGIMQPGIPSLYRVMGDAIYFDVPINEQRTYEILYLKQPTLLAAATDIPELPAHFHEAVSLWAVHNIQRLNNDYDGAYATKRELQELMQTLRLQGYNDMELENGGMTIYG